MSNDENDRYAPRIVQPDVPLVPPKTKPTVDPKQRAEIEELIRRAAYSYKGDPVEATAQASIATARATLLLLDVLSKR